VVGAPIGIHPMIQRMAAAASAGAIMAGDPAAGPLLATAAAAPSGAAPDASGIIANNAWRASRKNVSVLMR
jgi:hypothetical protein